MRTIRRKMMAAATFVGITAGLMLGAAGSAFAGPVQDSGPVAANQAFIGVVNGPEGSSPLGVCDSPTSPTNCVRD